MKANYQTISALIIIIITLLGLIISNIFLPKISIKKRITFQTFWVIPLLGAILLLCFQDVQISSVWKEISSNTSVNPMKVIALFFSMTFLSIFLDEVGFFSYIANIIANKFNKNQIVLFISLFVLISLLTLFTSNDIIILTFTPFIIALCRRCHIESLPYLMMEFISANTMSVAFIIGNPTNIYLASSYNISFIEYVKHMFVPAIVATLIAFIILFIVFNKKLKKPLDVQPVEIQTPNKPLTIVGGSILLITTIMLAVASYINIEMYLVALIGAGIELIFTIIYSLIKKDNICFKTLKHIPTTLLPFILSMFVIVLCLKEIGFTESFKHILTQGNPVFTYGFSGLLTANIINNIPMALLYEPMLAINNTRAIYATIFASNIAAYLTPLGALAGLMFLNLAKKGGEEISFLTFSKYGLLVGLPTFTIVLFIINFF